MWRDRCGGCESPLNRQSNIGEIDSGLREASVEKRPVSTSAWTRVGSGFVRFIQQALGDYQRERDWWVDAPPQRVLRVIAQRTLSIAFGLLGISGAALLYARTGEFPAARAVAAAMAALSCVALLFSARRFGESLVLDRLPYDGERYSRGTRSAWACAVLASVSAWVWCGYAVVQGRFWTLDGGREPIAFAVIGGLAMFISTYLLATSARALTVLVSPPSVHESIRQKIYGRSWVWIKSFETLE